MISGRTLLICCLLLFPVSLIQSQDTDTFITINAPAETLQTGQFYEVQIAVENVVDLQVISAEITYDPALLYVTGTRSGSPVQAGEFMGGTAAFVVRNTVSDDKVQLTFSRIRPLEAVSGSGIIGTFRVYPLIAGTTQLSFASATLTALPADSETPQTLAYTPVLSQITITGDTVAIPDEVTATPPPTSTPLTEETADASAMTDVPTATPLVNITRAPVDNSTPIATPTVATPDSIPVEDNSSLLMIAGAIVILVSLLGFAGLFIAARRGR